MRTDVQLGKTLQHHVLNDVRFPEHHQNTQCFPSIRERSANGVTAASANAGIPPVI